MKNLYFVLHLFYFLWKFGNGKRLNEDNERMIQLRFKYEISETLNWFCIVVPFCTKTTTLICFSFSFLCYLFGICIQYTCYLIVKIWIRLPFSFKLIRSPFFTNSIPILNTIVCIPRIKTRYIFENVSQCKSSEENVPVTME